VSNLDEQCQKLILGHNRALWTSAVAGFVAAGVLAGSVSCGLITGETLVAPNDVDLSRSYSLVSCLPDPRLPCKVSYSPAHAVFGDSGSLAFLPSHQARFRFMTTEWLCPCAYTGCAQPCVQQMGRVDTTMRYEFYQDISLGPTLGLFATPDTTNPFARFAVRIPARVSANWPGPDSLLYGSDLFNKSVLKPAP